MDLRPLRRRRPSRWRRCSFFGSGIGIWSKVLVRDLPGAVPGDHQHRGGLAHHQRAADRDAAELRRQRRQIFFKVSLPSALPVHPAPGPQARHRRAASIGVVVAELFGSRAGLGRLISQSADAFNMPDLFAGVIDAGGCRHRDDGGLRLAREEARALDQGLRTMARKLAITGLSK